MGIYIKSLGEYLSYLKGEILHPHYQNYFYLLIVLSLVVWGLEYLTPWRKKQSIIRKDFWLDAFYMFFNFFIFAAIIKGVYELIAIYSPISAKSFALLDFSYLPVWLGLLLFFLMNDFVQWFTHVLLHRFSFLWDFHKVHHSVKEMGFAAHLRYHWMENIFYKPLKTLVVLLIVGGEPQDAFIVHFIAITIGHLNHANLGWDYGFLKYVFNNPKMHIWHHAKEVPKERPYGMNYGISLSIWDYIFKTNYIPSSGRDIPLGFTEDNKFPNNFIQQSIYPLNKKDGNN